MNLKFIECLEKNDSAYPQTLTIHELFEKKVKETPDNIAALYEEEFLSYHELNVRANRLAWSLCVKGVCSNTIVGIMADRSLEMLVGVVAILKAGGAYLPLTAETPLGRVEYIVSDSNISLVMTQHKHINKLSGLPVDIFDLDDEESYANYEENVPSRSSPQDLMYVIYTSGSTGKPKGVMVSHCAVVNRLHWMQKKYPISADDIILQKTSFMFDVSVWELFWWMLAGAKVRFLRQGHERFPLAIAEQIRVNGITVLHFVPSMFQSFLYYLEHNSREGLKNLRFIFCSGEALKPIHVKKFYQIFNSKQKQIQLINLYGPTETTVDVTYYDCGKGEALEKVPIGEPIDNISIYIARTEHSENDKIGELCVAGAGLARGYINQPVLTHHSFVQTEMVKGGRLYKTGDLARVMPDGNIEYIGRIDHQIKVRGFRIELGEIEQVITDFPSVIQCVALIHEQGEAEARIMAYVVSSEPCILDELKNHLQYHLPEYMIPSVITFLSDLPLTPNGKVDRNRLLTQLV